MKRQSNPQGRSRPLRVNKCETCSQHPLVKSVLSNGQNDANSDYHYQDYDFNGSILTYTFHLKIKQIHLCQIYSLYSDSNRFMLRRFPNHVQAWSQQLAQSLCSKPHKVYCTGHRSCCSSIPGLYYNPQSRQQHRNRPKKFSPIHTSVSLLTYICFSINTSPPSPP